MGFVTNNTRVDPSVLNCTTRWDPSPYAVQAPVPL
jgi:hypothetical protein